MVCFYKARLNSSLAINMLPRFSLTLKQQKKLKELSEHSERQGIMLGLRNKKGSINWNMVAECLS